MTRLTLLLPLGFLFFVGCALSAEQRASIIDDAARVAGDRAAKLVLEQAAKAGLSPETTAELVALARAEAAETARKEADKRLPPTDPGGGNIFGNIVAAIIAALAGGIPALAKGGGSKT